MMKTTNRTKSIFASILILAAQSIFAVDWPQPVTETTRFSVDFARPYGGTFSTGIVFEEPFSVNATDTADVLITMTDSENLSMFDSPLGNSIIAINEENLMSIYSNLDEIKISEKDEVIIEGNEIATSGKSGWQKNESGLEFKIADIQSQSVINPLVLLPKILKTQAPHLYNITLVSKNGISYTLTQNRSIPAGTYSLYFEDYDPQPPFKVTVLLNGKEAETITYNMLKKIGRNLSIDGKRNYSYDVIYPGRNKQLLATASFTKGKTLLVIQTYDLNDNEKNMNYTLDVY